MLYRVGRSKAASSFYKAAVTGFIAQNTLIVVPKRTKKTFFELYKFVSNIHMHELKNSK